MHFEELVKKITPKLRGIIRRMNCRFFSLSEEDLYQEATLHLWQGYSCGELEDKTESYILQGCYFYLKNYLRCHRPKRNLISWESFYSSAEDDSSERRLELADPAAGGYQEKLDIKLLAETIRNNGLTGAEKELLSFYARGLTTREIGARLGVSHVRVVKMTQRIRQKCSKYLDKL